MDISGWTSGLFVPSRRSIGGIHAQVTIREQERDELQITEHPVEQGAPIADHAFKRPSEVQIRAGWSAAGSGNLGASGGVYGMLLSWQAALNPFDLYTGKRQYKHMLIQSLTVTTDAQSEFALMADIVCRQVIIVATKTGEAAKNPDNQKSPESNGASSDKGSQKARSIGESGDGSNRVAGESSDLVGTQVDPDLQKVPDGEQTLRGTGTEGPRGPETAKVESTMAKNDPASEIHADKGVLTPLKPGQTMVVPIPPPPPNRSARSIGSKIFHAPPTMARLKDVARKDQYLWTADKWRRT